MYLQTMLELTHMTDHVKFEWMMIDQTRGLTVNKRSGGTETRKCVTTRKDGVIDIEFGKNSDGNRYIKVTID